MPNKAQITSEKLSNELKNKLLKQSENVYYFQKIKILLL